MHMRAPIHNFINSLPWIRIKPSWKTIRLGAFQGFMVNTDCLISLYLSRPFILSTMVLSKLGKQIFVWNHHQQVHHDLNLFHIFYPVTIVTSQFYSFISFLVIVSRWWYRVLRSPPSNKFALYLWNNICSSWFVSTAIVDSPLNALEPRHYVSLMDFKTINRIHFPLYTFLLNICWVYNTKIWFFQAYFTISSF